MVKNTVSSKRPEIVAYLRISMFTIVTLSLIAVNPIQPNQTAKAYPANCVSQACREAADAADAASAKAAEASANADTLEGEVKRLEAEISSLEAEITANQATAADLGSKITENEQKLNLQQAALAKLLVNIHFETEPDTIILLASSNSLGDFAEKQSRQDTAKTQIAASAEAIRVLKADLEQQKLTVEALIENAEFNRNEITNKRNQQKDLISKYRDNAAAFTRDAEAARETMQKEVAAEIARYNSGGTRGNGNNTYPWAANCPADNIKYIVVGGYVCQCTSYAGWKVKERWGITISSWGDARNWGRSALARGYTVNSTPEPHTVGYSTSGAYGHVVWVESVNSNGTINLTEYNNPSSSASRQWGDFGARNNVNASSYHYIHFN